MNSRERVLAALEHKEPDRVPIDFGAMDSTGATAVAYRKLRVSLEIDTEEIRVLTPMGQEIIVDDLALHTLGADVKKLAIEPANWKLSTMTDGSPCLVPEMWDDQLLPDGSRVVKNDEGRIIAKMPKGGYYFDRVFYPLAGCSNIRDLDKYQKYFDAVDWSPIYDEDFSHLSRRAKDLYENTDFALFGLFGAHIFAAGQALRGWDQFLIDLMDNPILAEGIMDKLVDAHIEHFNAFHGAVGNYIQIINVNDDLGTQTGPFLSPELYRKRVKPYHKKLFRHIKDHCHAYLFLHSDGAIRPLIPDLIECGIDILNPVQFTARDMDSAGLKKDFGRDLTFWGGGCDTQSTLPLGNPDAVKAEVKRQLDILAPGGGYVFTQVHNIQEEVPPRNVVAMYEAVREWEESR